MLIHITKNYFSTFILYMDIEKQYRELQKNRKNIKFINVSYEEYKSKHIIEKKKKLKLAIIIPFREHKGEKVRTHQLRKFIRHMKTFFSNKDIKMKIFVINQTTYDKKFNRGLLLNIGFDFAKKFDIIVTHDVDLALKFATKIVLIEKKKDETIKNKDSFYGLINNNSIYYKKSGKWINNDKEKSAEMVQKELLRKFITNDKK